MKKILLTILVSALVLTGCSDSFFDINQSPNNATEENMTPSLILPRALHRAASEQVTDYDALERWMGYWARCAGTYGPNTEEEAYQITSSFMRTPWLNWYDILKDFDVIEKNAVTRNETAYEGIAIIMKSIGFMQLVDMYNNVPYSKAFDLANNLLTPYDKGSDIYKDLIIQLAKADDLLKNAVVSENMDLQKADIVFKGDLSLWRKLGNSQRLRLLIHESQVLGDAGLKTEIDKIVANGGGFLGAGETAEVQPGYAKDVSKQNPYWNTYKINDAGGLDNYNRANNYFLNILGSTDPRLSYFYSAAKTPKSGVNFYGFDYGHQASSDVNDASSSSDVAGTGPGPYSTTGTGKGIAKGPDMAQWIFPSFESMFLQAEAIQRGALSGDAKTAYQNAVTESFAWLKVENATTAAQTYLSGVSNLANWDTSTKPKLDLILIQKYIAMYGINGLESWTDYRRTGLPSDIPLSIDPSRGANVIPLRLIYPIEEYQYNKANVAAEGTINPQSSKIFWDK